ncbi:TPA: hypothetical protein ACQUHH_000011 [Bacillus mobilis]
MDEFLASYVLEHIEMPLDAMEELHRIAKPNAKMVCHVPYGSSDDAFEDPTHCRQFFYTRLPISRNPSIGEQIMGTKVIGSLKK